MQRAPIYTYIDLMDPHAVVMNLIVFCADFLLHFKRKTALPLVRWPELLVEPIFAALKLDWSRLIPWHQRIKDISWHQMSDSIEIIHHSINVLKL